jgi:hypothetical protein
MEAMMQKSLRSILAFGGAVLLAAAVTPALAGDGQMHVLTVPLPGGGVEQIRYTDDVAPRVVVVPPARIVAAPMMAFDPFAELERISAMMDRQAAAMLRQVDAPPEMMMPGLPQGAAGYSFASTMSGDGACVHSVSITYHGGDAAPKVVSSTSGNCGSDHGVNAPVEIEQPAPAPRPTIPHTIEVKADGPTRVAWNR